MVIAMINRVGEYEKNTYDYNKLKTPQTSGSEEKFSLNYQGEDQITSSKEEKDDKKTSETGQKNVSVQKSGVTLEISHAQSRSDAESQSEKQDTGVGSMNTLLDTLQNVFRKILQAVRDVAYKIWNDPAPAETTETADTGEAEEVSSEQEERLDLSTMDGAEVPEADKNAKIQEYLHSGNLDQVMNLVTDYGKKSVAKNSDLLTYYDRQGRLTELDPSDIERIMHGDRNVRKL
jgi:hypothetical protein